MSLTKFDAGPALIVIDLQNGIVGGAFAHPAAKIVSRTVSLVRAFRERGLPVALINVIAAPPGRTEAGSRVFAPPHGWSDLVPELNQQPTDILIQKKCVGSFIGTDLHDILQQRGVSQVFLTGIATSAGVEGTGRNAYDLGYHVVFVVDAITDRSIEAHSNCVETVFPRFGETVNSVEVMRLLRA